MENKLEQLLNSLIEKGWKPFEDKRITNVSWKLQYVGTYNWVFWSNHNMIYIRKSTRELVSKSSGLWQFVCENGMIKNANDYSWELYNGEHGQYEVYKNGYEGGKRWEQVDYEYRLIESALCDEDKLEEFLLNSIKLD